MPSRVRGAHRQSRHEVRSRATHPCIFSHFAHGGASVVASSSLSVIPEIPSLPLIPLPFLLPSAALSLCVVSVVVSSCLCGLCGPCRESAKWGQAPGQRCQSPFCSKPSCLGDGGTLEYWVRCLSLRAGAGRAARLDGPAASPPGRFSAGTAPRPTGPGTRAAILIV